MILTAQEVVDFIDENPTNGMGHDELNSSITRTIEIKRQKKKSQSIISKRSNSRRRKDNSHSRSHCGERLHQNRQRRKIKNKTPTRMRKSGSILNQRSNNGIFA